MMSPVPAHISMDYQIHVVHVHMQASFDLLLQWPSSMTFPISVMIYAPTVPNFLGWRSILGNMLFGCSIMVEMGLNLVILMRNNLFLQSDEF